MTWSKLAGAARTATCAGLAAAALMMAAAPAEARRARCETTDDGSFACEFRRTASDGSFEISAPGKPTYRLNVSAPGVAYGFVTLEGRNIPLPSRYLRSAADPACWVNEATAARICAR